MITKDITVDIDKLSDRASIRIRNLLNISENLDKELDEAAGWFGYYEACAVRAETNLEILELEFEVWKANLEKDLTLQRKLSGDKSLTKDQMSAELATHGDYISWQKRLIKARESKRMLRGLGKAFEKKVETVRTKCSNRRKERGE